MANIPCEVIRDLFPSYVDGLTSEKTNAEIEEHLKSCPACTKILKDLKGDAEEEIRPTERDVKEIDFLKKTRRMQRIAICSSLITVILFLLFIALRIFVVGVTFDGASFAVEKLTIQDGELHLRATSLDSAHVLSRVRFEEENGIVVIRPKAALVSFFHSAGKEYTYKLKDEKNLRQIWLGNKIIWEDGANISSLTAAVYATKHAYVGDASANQRTMNALNAYSRIGDYENQLETAKEPYGWIIRLKENLPSAGEEKDPYLIQMESDMEAMAYVLLGVVGNLDHVTFEYTVGGEKMEKTITAKDATEFLGQDVKDCGGSVRVLEALFQKTGF
ncbi:MAG: DUF4825 domain-containing protein [Acetatifactor sp.]|nr:DUF4825 domain-containing protein [Acetatifactor sp.]